jgi:hypothetical protein
MTREFRQYASNMRVNVKNISVETHHSIKMIERYYESLRRVYAIISTKIFDIQSDLALQMTFKVINNSMRSNELVLTLLVFDAYSRMIESDVFSIITQRVVVMRKIMNEIRKDIAARQINDAINTRNDSFTEIIHDLSLNSDVLMFREKNTDQSDE